MEALDRHQQRVQRMQQSLERLLALHGQIYDLQGEIVALSQGHDDAKVARVKELRAKVRGLMPEVEKAKAALTGRGE